EQHVAADDTTIRNPMLDVNRNVSRFHKEESVFASLVDQRELARIEFLSAQANARARQQPKRVVLHSSFGNRDRDHLSRAILRPTTSVNASRFNTKPTAGSTRPKFPVNPS